jgi:hypothetical protein
MERLIANLIAGEVNGRLILGTTGEVPLLRYQTRREVIQYLSACADVELPIAAKGRELTPAIAIFLQSWALRSDLLCSNCSRTTFFRTLPTEVRGSISQNSIRSGTLYAARFAAQWERT